MKNLKILLLFSFLFFSVFQNAWPENKGEVEKLRIKELYIRGNRYVSTAIIKKQIKLIPGRIFKMEDANEDIKRLYKTGYFSKVEADVKPTSDGQVILTYFVTEEPVVKKIEILGNTKIKTKKLLRMLPFEKDDILSENKVSEGKEKIKNYYIKRGYMNVRVEYKIVRDEENNSATVYYYIDEKRRVRIKKIKFIGAKHIKPRKLRKIMKTKSKFFFIRSGYFKEKDFKDDLERIKAYYYKKGYIDIKILDVKKIFSKNGKYLTIVIKLKEGKRYKIGSIEYKGNSIFSDDELRKGSLLKPNEYFLPENLRDDLKRIEHLYYKQGYIDTVVDADTLVDERGNLKVVYYIKESQRVYVKKIKIIGNTKTKDIVIRREITVAPGEVFDGVMTEISEKRLKNSGLFEDVKIYPDPEEKGKYRDLIIKVKEGRTGQLSFGAGFSSVENFLGFIEIEQKNFDLFNWPYFTGDAQKLKLRAEYGDVRKDFVLSFIEPWFLDKRLSFGIDLFKTETSYKDSVYDEDRKGGDIKLSWPIGKFSRMSTFYSYEKAKIYNVSESASDLIKKEEGLRTISKIGVSITRDTRDSYFFPTSGMKTTLSGELAGIGGNTNYYQGIFSHYSFFDVFGDTVLMFKFKTGIIKEFGDSDDVPIFDKFFIGGPSSIRGFKYRDVGPHDSNGDAIGGKFYAYTTLEYTVPVFKRISVATFFDVGNLYAEPDDVDFGELNGSVGLGLRLRLPIGPLSLDYGYPVITDDYHEGENGVFTFNMGTTF